MQTSFEIKKSKNMKSRVRQDSYIECRIQYIGELKSLLTVIILKFCTSPETGNEQISTWTAYKDNWGWQHKFRGKFSKDNGLRPLKIWNDQQCYNFAFVEY